MAGTNSKWLGPNTRKKVLGSETAGVPRPRPPVSMTEERRGFYKGARIYRDKQGEQS